MFVAVAQQWGIEANGCLERSGDNHGGWGPKAWTTKYFILQIPLPKVPGLLLFSYSYPGIDVAYERYLCNWLSVKGCK